MKESDVPRQKPATEPRPARGLGAPVELLDLVADGKQLMVDAAQNASHRAAKTLSMNAALRVVLMAVKSGTDIREHSVPGPAVVHLLEGRAHFEIGELAVEVARGNAITLAAGLEHRLSVAEDAVLVLVIAGS